MSIPVQLVFVTTDPPALERISSIAKGSRDLADMEVRIDKTETIFPRDDECG